MKEDAAFNTQALVILPTLKILWIERLQQETFIVRDLELQLHVDWDGYVTYLS